MYSYIEQGTFWGPKRMTGLLCVSTFLTSLFFFCFFFLLLSVVFFGTSTSNVQCVCAHSLYKCTENGVYVMYTVYTHFLSFLTYFFFVQVINLYYNLHVYLHDRKNFSLKNFAMSYFFFFFLVLVVASFILFFFYFYLYSSYVPSFCILFYFCLLYLTVIYGIYVVRYVVGHWKGQDREKYT